MEVPNGKVTIVQHGKGEEIHVGPLVMHVLEDGSHTDNRIGAVTLTIPPHSSGPPQHWHLMHDETFLITSGTVRFHTGTTHHDVVTGDYVVVPPMAPHTFSNASDEAAVMYSSMTPAFYVDYFRLLQGMARKNGGKLDPKDGVEAMRKYATLVVEGAGPPGTRGDHE